MSEYREKLKAVNLALAEARDDLHDAKIGGDRDQVEEVEKRIQELRQTKSDILRESNGN